MTKKELQKLLKVASDDDQNTLKTLFDGCAALEKKYKKTKARKDLTNWTASKKELKKVGDRLHVKYFNKDEILENILAVVDFLIANGYRIKKTKAYADAKKGLLKVRDDKTVLKSDALDYAEMAGVKKVNVDVGSINDIKLKTAQVELRIKETKDEKLKFELDREKGKYLLKSDVAVENATKFGIIEAGIKHLMRTKAAQYCEIVGGNGKRAVNLIEAFNLDVDSIFNQFCSIKALTGSIELEE